jgi:GSH-dependent disulfide-bond oxidoreductase
VELDGLPHLKRWRDQLRARPAVQRGIEQPAAKVDLSRDGDAAAQRFAEEARRLVEMGQSGTSAAANATKGPTP